jgi:ferredoxin
MCAMLAPAVFQLDKTGTLVVLLADVPEEHVEAVRDAVACCPTDAISSTDDSG